VKKENIEQKHFARHMNFHVISTTQLILSLSLCLKNLKVSFRFSQQLLLLRHLYALCEGGRKKNGKKAQNDSGKRK
jgi:hypothetical protein